MLDVILYGVRVGGMLVLLWVLNWLQALAIIVGYSLVKWLLFRFVLGIRRMNQTSAMWANPTAGSSSYILGATLLDRFSYPEAECWFLKFSSFSNAPRLRLRMVRVLDEMYWCSEDDFSVRKHLHVLNSGPITDTRELLQLMAVHMQRPVDPTLSPWEVYLVPEFAEGRYAMFIKFHHGLGDGIALQHFISACSDVEPQIVQKLLEPSLCRDVLFYLLFPVVFVYALCKTSCVPQRPSVLAEPNRPLAGIKTAATTDSFSLERLKRVTQHFNITINDFLLTVVLACLREFLETEYQAREDSQLLAIPFNIRERPCNSQAFECGNHVGVLSCPFPLPSIVNIVTDSSVAFASITNYTRSLKQPLLPHAFKSLHMMNEVFPHSIGRSLILGPTNKCPIIFTNVAGSRTQLIMSGHPIDDIIYLAPGMGINAISLCVSSYYGHLRLTASADINRMERLEVFVAMISKMINEYLQEYSNSPSDSRSADTKAGTE